MHRNSVYRLRRAVAERFGLRGWSIRARIVVVVLSLAVPLNLLVIIAIWQLAQAAAAHQRTSLLFTARTLASAVDLHVGKQINLAQALANSPALLSDDLSAFETEALRAFPPSGDAFLVVADLDGQQLYNSGANAIRHLPIRNAAALAAQRRAFEHRTVVVADRIVVGPLTGQWLATIEVPVFRNGQPFRAIAVAMTMQPFQRLLNEQQVPAGWLTGLIDADGRFLARVPEIERLAGSLASEGWRRTMHLETVNEFRSLEGTPIVQANAHPSLAHLWTVGMAVPLSALQTAAWDTVRQAAFIGAVLSFLSLALAVSMARQIALPIAGLEKNASALIAGSVPASPAGPPEVDRLVATLVVAAAERERGEDAMRRLASIVVSSLDAIVSKTLQGSVTTWNSSAEAMFGYTAGEMIGSSVRKLIPADRQNEEDLVLERLSVNERVATFETIRVRKDGTEIPVSLTLSPLTDRNGRVVGASTIVRDISEQRAREQQIRLLLGELSHRSKNLLAVVQSIANQTASRSPAEFLHRFSHRLQSLAVNQDLLARNDWSPIDLGTLLAAQLSPFDVGDRVHLDGPAIALSPAAAQAIGMATHELATNAVKYGALKNDAGRIDVCWDCAGEAFRLAWSETGLSAVQPPETEGFGSFVTGAMIASTLTGTVSATYRPTGLLWTLDCPLTQLNQASSRAA